MKPFDAHREVRWHNPSLSDLFFNFGILLARNRQEWFLISEDNCCPRKCSPLFAFLLQQLRCSLRCFCARTLFQFAEDFHLRLRFLRPP